MRRVQPLFLFLVATHLLAGCECGPGTTAVHGSPALQLEALGPSALSVRVDFGSRFFSERAEAVVRLRNIGRGSLTIEEFLTEGPVDAGGEEARRPESVFHVVPETLQLGAGEETLLRVVFAPMGPSGDGRRFEDYAATVRIRFGGTVPEEAVGVLEFVGRGVEEACGASRTLDFGVVAVGESERLETVLSNPTLLPTEARLGAIQSNSGDHGAFRFADGTVPGSIALAPDSQRNVVVEFLPTEARPFLAYFRTRASEQCPDAVVTMTGTGVDNLLVWAPTLDCGYVPVGVEKRLPVVLTNLGPADIEVANLAIASPHFALAAAGASMTVPGGGTATREVICRPQVAGPVMGQLAFTTSLPRQPQGAVQLRGFGAGPDIDAQPGILNFGKVAFVAGAATQPSQTRKLYVQNLGAPAPDGDVAANLRLGRPDASGALAPPYFEVVPGPGTLPGELTVEWPPSYDPLTGIRAIVGQQVLPVVVRVTPASAGAKSAVVRFFSNDLDEPVFEVMVHAQALELPPCRYDVSPTQLPFGIVMPPDSRTLSFVIRNLGTAPEEVCLFSSLALSADTHASYSLLAPWESVELPAGGSREVVVRLEPGAAPIANLLEVRGAARFDVSSPQTPEATVALSGWVGPTCVVVSPSSVDFGTVKLACHSATRTISVYNSCPAAVTITDVAVTVPAGVPARAPNCPGSTACREYALVNHAPLPSGGLTLAPGATAYSFDVRYSPLNDSMDVGAVTVSTNEGGRALAYTVRLDGRGDPAGIHTDSFVQPAVPKVDILFVLEQVNVCGDEADPLPALETTIADFRADLLGRGIDFHMGFIKSTKSPSGTTNGSPSPPCDGFGMGELVTGYHHGLRYLVPSDGEPLFQDSLRRALFRTLNCPNDGFPFEATAQAVSPALRAGPNAGFLRSEASLAVISFSRQGDIWSFPQALWWSLSYTQGRYPTAYYRNALLAAKPGQSHLVSFSAVSSFDPNNACGGGADFQGRTEEMVSTTGGFMAEICTCPSNWQSEFEALALKLEAGLTRFPLTSAPDSTFPIVVTVDGLVVPATGTNGSSNWSHDPLANMIVFATHAIPPPGASIQVSYQPVCH